MAVEEAEGVRQAAVLQAEERVLVNPFIPGKSKKIKTKAVKLKSTRDIILFAAAMDVKKARAKEEPEELIVGYVW